MNNEITKIANSIWNRAASPSAPAELSFEISFYKKFIDIFHVGNYFYSVFNYQTNDFDLVDIKVESVLGYSKDSFSVPFFMSCIHPDDMAYFINFENQAIDFLTKLPIIDLAHYKTLHECRVQKADGKYIRLLKQGIVLEHDENGGILRTLTVHTDITHLKPNGQPVLSFIGLEGRPSFIDVKAEKIIISTKEILTLREKQVLRLLMEGKLSKQIALQLGISKVTVDRHRKNMLQKTDTSTVAELITKAITHGWLI